MEPLTRTDWKAIHAMPFPAPSPRQLRAICARHGLPQGPFGRLPSTGAINAIITIGDDLLLRVPKDVDEGRSDTLTESVAVPAASAAGVRTPALVAFDESGEHLEVPYGVYEWWHLDDGEPTTEEGWRELGRDLARLHAVDHVDDPFDRLDKPGRSSSIEELRSWVGKSIDETSLAVLRTLEPAVAAWAAAPVDRFLHDDLKGSNLLVDADGGYAAMIDWGDAGWGDPAIDFRRLPPASTPWVVEGYREVRTPEHEATFADRIRWDQVVHRLVTERPG